MTGGSTVVTRGGTVDDSGKLMWQYGSGTWANHRLTRGMLSLVGKGATWPNPGLPRGTPLLVDGLIKIGLVARRGSNP
jgi:hypothetical protein